MTTLNCKAILFDLDGTLVDSAFRVQRLWLEWSKRKGIDTDALLEVMHGRRMSETIQILAPHLSLQDEIEELEMSEVTDMNDVYPYSGANEMLSKLSSRQWAIVTSGTLRVASARIKYVGLPTPEVFVTADVVKAGKPAPDAYLLAAKQLHVEPSDCVVVEDAPAGIQAGKAAGMRTIAIASSLPKKALDQADVIVSHLADIMLYTAGDMINIQFK